MAQRWSLWYRLVRSLVRQTFFRATGGLIPVGEANVPLNGPLIVAPVHVSFLDPPAVACALPRGLRFMAKEELFRFRPFGALIASLGSFPVRRGTNDSEAVRRAIAELESGHAVLIFPEGTRNDGSTMLPINRGVALLAKRTGAPVLPVGIAGTSVVWPRGQKRLRRHRITVVFGQPFAYADCEGASEKETRERFAAELERRILEACHTAGWTALTTAGSTTHSTCSPHPDAPR